ncbi:hypothetical protein DWQ65_06355 [Treponema phagedenis]|uniref:SoxR reducing system RseC family protein n=1 Tax=Treponema phagedenis TaxID=162 RepID=A0A0B7H1M0_TREPH|nr:SoxR reducing system RseC family protein [Treponema phagedenis]EFW38087.1 hypothetical protein HMPREF9554_01410 [Treponema phagedenis F0421]NVP24498.1 SoxR reducing system RseC family protein [Treponema phagedenis]QEJ95516.1 SoxR reducing system RseC family protein [Treponema phagedenis]QEJ97742.1 SoxR reducing system RseC family protein [Treponema phagedenis]QEK01370.1 SoxR reducing system RseC family protein [Treponema phagedenis]
MRKRGIVKAIEKKSKDGFQKLKIELIQDTCACSIKSTDTFNAASRPSCAGCNYEHAETGLFVINGNEVIALNKKGKSLSIGDAVTVITTKMQTLIQILISIIVPLFLAALGYGLIFRYTDNQGTAILGILVGLICGTLLAFLIKHVLGDRVFPEVIGN